MKKAIDQKTGETVEIVEMGNWGCLCRIEGIGLVLYRRETMDRLINPATEKSMFVI